MMTGPNPFDDALDDLRISGSVLLHEAYRPDWAIDVPDEAELRRLLGVGRHTRILPFHLVRKGGFDLSDGKASLRLDEPELSLILGGQAHRLSVGRGTQAIGLAQILSGEGPTRANDTSANATEIVCGCLVTRSAPLNPLLGALPSMFKIAAGGDSATPTLSSVASLLAAELGRQQRNSFTTQRLLEILCAEAIRAFQASEADERPGWFRGLADPKIAEALHCVHAAPGDNWTVEALAARVALSPSRFAARFRETTGESVMGYVARWRANLACRLLRETDLPLAEIGLQIGYQSLPAFSRAFKALVGSPPAQWRHATSDTGQIIRPAPAPPRKAELKGWRTSAQSAKT